MLKILCKGGQTLNSGMNARSDSAPLRPACSAYNRAPLRMNDERSNEFENPDQHPGKSRVEFARSIRPRRRLHPTGAPASPGVIHRPIGDRGAGGNDRRSAPDDREAGGGDQESHLAGESDRHFSQQSCARHRADRRRRRGLLLQRRSAHSASRNSRKARACWSTKLTSSSATSASKRRGR